MTDLPPVKVEFEAKVAEAIAKIEELKAAIRSVGSDRNSVIRITDGGSTRRTADNARRDMRRAGDDTERDWRQVFRRIQSDNDRSMGQMIRRSRQAGGDSARGFWQRFDDESRRHRGLGLAPGGQRADWGRLIGMTMPAIAPAAAGLALPLAGAFEVAMPALFSTAAIAPFAVDAFGKVQKAAQTLETQQDKYNQAASRTAIATKTDSDAAKGYADLLQGLNPAEKDLVEQLGKQDVSWDSLTKRQQLGAIQMKENKEAYKELSPAQKEALNALIAERAAWVNLDPAQAKALRNYQTMSDTFDRLKQKIEPTMFRVLADAETAATDAMRPLEPVLRQVALGFDDLFVGLDHWFKSDDYQHFIDMWSGDARKNIDSVGGAIGRIGLGLIHMYEAMHPLMGPTESWLDRITKKFADWPTSPKGQTQFQNFLHDITTQGPLVWGTLKNIGHSFDLVVAALAGNPLPWLVLKDISKVMVWIASAPGGRVAINILAWAFALTRMAQALKLVAAYQGVMTVLGRIGVGAAAGAAGASAAAGAAGISGLTVLSASRARVLGITNAGATLGETTAVRGAAAGAAGSGMWAAVANPVGATVALAAGAAVAAYAITKWAEHIRQKSDAAAGIVRHADGQFTAATSVGGTHVSTAFQNLANTYKAHITEVSTLAERHQAVLEKDGRLYGQGSQQLADEMARGNKQVKDVMYLGRTQFGQAAGLFADSWGHDVAKMGAALKQQGHTLNKNFEDAMASVFQGLGGKTAQSWKSWQQEMAANLDNFFAKQRKTTQDDVTAVQSAWQRLTDDAYHHRAGREQQDIQALEAATKRFMDDENRGLIDHSNKKIKQLSADLAQFMSDLASGNSKAWSKDIARLGADTKGHFSAMADSVGAAASHAYDVEIAKAQSDIARLSKQIAGNILGPLTGHADGGKITGPGTGRSDSIVTRVSNGEFIVNAAATSRHLALLEAINGKGYANGGLVGFGGEDVNRNYLLWKGWEAVLANTSKGPLNTAAQYEAVPAAGGGGNVQRWAPLVAKVLQLLHAPGGALNAVLTRINIESGGNPNAINRWDINAQHGDPSRGLMQTIMSTFNAYAGPYRGRGIYDPFANIYAGVNYAMHTYGSNWIRVMTRPGGYDEGGIVPPGLSAVLNSTRKPEALLNSVQWRSISRLAALGARASAGVTVPIVVTLDGRKIYEAVRTRGWQAQVRSGRDMWSLT